MSILGTLKKFFKGETSDPSVLIACNNFSLAIGKYEISLNQVDPYTSRTEDAERMNNNFTDFERSPAAYLDAYTKAIDAATTEFDALTSELLNFPVKSGELYEATTNLFKGIYKLYLIHASAYSKAAKYAALASAIGLRDSLICEFEAMKLASSARSADESNIKEDLLRDSTDMKSGAERDRAIASQLEAKVNEATQRISASIARALNATGGRN
jgi:hypothetical protein